MRSMGFPSIGSWMYIGCKDEFGVTPADVAPKTPLGGTYPAGTQTSALLALFNAAGLSACSDQSR